MKITAKVIKLPEFDRMHIRPGALERAAMAGGQVIEANAKINAEQVFSGKSTGGAGLAGSIQTVLTGSSTTKADVSVGPSVVYGRIQELGGWVKTVHAKILRFFVDGVAVFAKAVYIPPRPYLRPAVDGHEDEVRAAIAASLKRDVWQGLI